MERKGVKILDAEQYPFPVKPEDSDLAKCPNLRTRLDYEYPLLDYCDAVMADGNIIIQDIQIGSPVKIRESVRLARDLNLFSTRTIQVIDGADATSRLLRSFRPYSQKLKDFLVVYPLSAGAIVKRYICEYIRIPDYSNLSFLCDGIELPVKRVPAGKGRYSVSADKGRLEMEKEPKGVLVIDDVVASGETAYTIQAAVKNTFGASTPCYYATWLLVEPPPTTVQKSGVPLSDRAFASYVIRGNMMSRPPINSLSCFLQRGRESEAVKREYYNRYVFDPEGFDSKLQEMKSCK